MRSLSFGRDEHSEVKRERKVPPFVANQARPGLDDNLQAHGVNFTDLR